MVYFYVFLTLLFGLEIIIIIIIIIIMITLCIHDKSPIATLVNIKGI